VIRRIFIPFATFLLVSCWGFVSHAQEERWITVKIINVEEGIPDARQQPSFRITVEVEMVGCTRATLALTSSAEVDGKLRSWVTNDGFSTPHPGRVKRQAQLLVSASSLRDPPAGAPIEFSVNARGYYTIREMQQVEYIEYVPVQRQVPGYQIPGTGHH